jgi:4'-phosphopantetheinyl transferase
VNIYISEIVKSYDDSTLSKLDKDRRYKIKELKIEEEKYRSITAGLLLYHAFIQSGYSNEQWDNITVSYGEYGKPYLDGYEQFNYSISHSGNYCICAVDSEGIGADIQEMRPWRLQMAKRFFNQSEYERLASHTSTDEAEREFYNIWTAKESVAKLIGRGIGAGISHLVTDSEYDTINDLKKNKRYNIKIFDEIEGYVVCVCSRKEIFPDRLKVMGE